MESCSHASPSPCCPHSPALHYVRDDEGRLLEVAGACERFLGCPPPAAVGRNLEEWLGGSSTNLSLWSQLQASSRHGDADVPVELEIHSPGGDPLWVEIRENPFAEAGSTNPSLPSVAGVLIDITARRLREAQLVEAQRLENLGLLAAGIAHDLNNILSPILIAGSLLEPLAQEPAHQRMVKVLQSSAERGARIVRQILNFAHADEEGRGPLDVNHVIREFLLVIEETFPRSIHLDIDLEPEPPMVLANPTQLHQLLLNLAVNARDVMPDGGTLGLKLETYTLDAPPAHATVAANQARWMRIRISDTGCGMSPEQLEQIWTPFYTTKPTGQGTGLGLSTVRTIVTAHGGFLEVDSTVGTGSTFTINLPTLPPATEVDAPAAELADHHPPPGLRVLVVDDESSVRNVIRETLGSRGYEVVLASDGIEALSVINFNPDAISLVITDVHMPHMAGDVLVNVLRRFAPQLPILAISGHPNVAARWEAPNQAQPDASLAKPFSGRVLLHTVHGLIQGRLNPPDRS